MYHKKQDQNAELNKLTNSAGSQKGSTCKVGAYKIEIYKVLAQDKLLIENINITQKLCIRKIGKTP